MLATPVRVNALAVSMYLAQLVLGVLHITDYATPNSLIVQTDYRVAAAWSCMLIVSAVAGLVGSLGRDAKVLEALAWEAGASTGLALLNGLYVVVLWQFTHGRGVVQTVALLSVATAGFSVRAAQCAKRRRKYERQARGLQAALTGAV